MNENAAVGNERKGTRTNCVRGSAEERFVAQLSH